MAIEPQGAHPVNNQIAQAMGIVPKCFEDAKALSESMAKCMTLPDHLKGKAPDCLAVVWQALTWGINPYGVAQCTSLVKGKMCYEGKLIAAIVNDMGGLKGSLNYTYEGSGDNIVCTVSGTLKGEDEPRTVTVRKPPKAQQNSTLWGHDDEQQLSYLGARKWARRHTPQVLFGILSRDEIEDDPRIGPEEAVNVTPTAADRLNAFENGTTVDTGTGEVTDAEVTDEAPPPDDPPPPESTGPTIDDLGWKVSCRGKNNDEVLSEIDARLSLATTVDDIERLKKENMEFLKSLDGEDVDGNEATGKIGAGQMFRRAKERVGV